MDYGYSFHLISSYKHVVPDSRERERLGKFVRMDYGVWILFPFIVGIEAGTLVALHSWERERERKLSLMEYGYSLHLLSTYKQVLP